MVTIEVCTFNLGNNEEKARKVCEEAVEFFGEHRMYDICGNGCNNNMIEPLMLEIGDVITAIVNYAAANGIDVQKCVDYAETKNVIRGRYDNMDT